MYINPVSVKSHSFYSWMKEVAAPTAVEHSLYCHFISSQKKSLVTIGGTRLNVYDIDERSSETGKPLNQSSYLGFSFGDSFYDDVYDVACIRFVGDHLDSLVVSFREAKFSVLRFDPASREIQTVSLHNYEYEQFKRGQLTFGNGPLIRADVANRCAAGLIYDHHLVVFPVRRDITMGAGASAYFSTLNGGIPMERQVSHNVMSSGLFGGFASSYTIDLRSVDRIHTVIDMQFLHGYYHPTLLVLFETIGTWAGRVTARSDTCVISALSLNMQERSCPIIWTVQNLPYNSFRLLAVPRPICGVVLLTVNAFIYLNQSQPACALALNSFALEFTHYRLRLSKGPYISLDSCQTAVLNESGQFLVVLRRGEIFVFSLLLDMTMKVVSDVRYEQVGKTVSPNSVSVCDDKFLFIGSRLADSQLYSVVSYSISYPKVDKVVTEAMMKTIDTVGISLNNEETDELYGSYHQQQAKESMSLYLYAFQEIDSLVNWAPIGRLTTGEISGWSSIFPEHSPHTDFSNVEMVVSSGWSQSGAIKLLQRTLRPRVKSTFELTGFNRLWTVYGSQKLSFVGSNLKTNSSSQPNEDMETNESQIIENPPSTSTINPSESGFPVHNYIVLSRQDSTMILEVDKELVEISHCGFSTTEPTLLLGNIGEVYRTTRGISTMDPDYRPFIIQVLPNLIRLLSGTELIECVQLDSDWSVKMAFLQDPFVLLVMEDEELFLFHMKDPHEKSRVRSSATRRLLVKSKPKFGSSCVMQACCMYRDEGKYLNCLLGQRSVMQTPSNSQTFGTSNVSLADFSQRRFDTIEDEDLLLYGKIITEVKNEGGSLSRMDIDANTDSDSRFTNNQVEDSRINSEVYTWSFLVTSNNKLHLVTLPDFTVRYTISNILEFDSILWEEGDPTDMDIDDNQNIPSVDAEDAPPVIQEILVVPGGHRGDTPYMMIRTQHEVHIYQAFIYSSPGLITYQQLRWKRLFQPCLLKAPRRIASDVKYEEVRATFHNRQCMQYFSHIGVQPNIHRGVFICGPHPHWIFIGRHGNIHIFPMLVDGMVTDFQQFHNLDCFNGFAYLNHLGELRLSTLYEGYSYENELGMRNVPINRTVHFLQYHVLTKTYVVVTSEECQTKTVFKLSADGDKEEETFNRDSSFTLPYVNQYYLQLFSPSDDWQEVIHSRVQLEPWERILCMETVQLSSQETVRGLKDYLVGGTNLCYGEEIPVRGKILIADVIDVVPEPGLPLTRFRLKVFYHEEQKGPVSAVCSCQGFLVTAIGQKIYIWSLKDNDLVGVAFVDSDIYIHSLCSVKNLILAADMLKSVSLLRFQVQLRVLSRVCRDINLRCIHAANFFIDGKTLAFCATDNENNLMLYVYDPLESSNTQMQHKYVQRLIRTSDTHLPIRVNHCLRIRNAIRDPVLINKDFSLLDQEATKQSLYFGSVEGSIYRLAPLRDKVMSRLSIIEKNLAQALVHLAGLHPVASRQYRYSQPELTSPCGGIANGDLLWRYLTLPHSQRVEVAKKSGLTMEGVLDDIVELYSSTLHF